MTKAETIKELAEGTGCLGRSQEDEPVFILCARDKAAASTVVVWAQEASRLGASEQKIGEALSVAEAMDRWRIAHGGGKLPD